MGFEDQFLAGMDRNRRSVEFLHPNIEKAHRRTEHIFRKEAIDMELFKCTEDGRKGVYASEEVDQDLLKTKVWKEKFRKGETDVQKNLRAQAEVVEGLVYRGIGKYGWFADAEAIKTADFDDYKNGVDLMIEFGHKGQSPQKVLGLMVDITFSGDRNTGALDKKIERIQKEIEEGHLASVKYFQSRNAPFMGRFNDMPRVIIGMERAKILELATLWVNEEREEELTTHPIQRMILEQILVQLQAQLRYAKVLGKNNIASILEEEAHHIQHIIEGKDIPMGNLQFDGVHEQIMSAMQTFGEHQVSSGKFQNKRDSSVNVDDTTKPPADTNRPRRPLLSLKQ
jgi:hypothetical protein